MTRALVIASLAVLAALAAAGCRNTSPVGIKVELTSGSDQTCPPPQACSAIKVTCPAVLSVRIVSPDQPDIPVLSLCQQIQLDRGMDLCSIDSVTLPSGVELPDETLEIEIAVYALSDVTADPTTGALNCPVDVDFAASNGFPTNASPTPAIGGRAYHRADDGDTTVELGCTNLAALDAPSCTGSGGVAITASVDDFDTGVDVSTTLANQLTVSVGEPMVEAGSGSGSATVETLDPADTRPLARTAGSTTPAWGADVDLAFQTAACLEVLEDGTQDTASLACARVNPMATSLDLHGTRLAKPTLDALLAAAGTKNCTPAGCPFPDAGLVIGIVVDSANNPVAGVTVKGSAPTAPTIEYLSADRSTFIGTATTSAGVFISPDAAYATTWGATSGALTASAFGGLVAGKVTIVVLQLAPPS